MANTRSAEKQQRQAEKATVRNRAGKSRLRSSLKKALAFNCKDRPNRFGGHGVCALFAW